MMSSSGLVGEEVDNLSTNLEKDFYDRKEKVVHVTQKA